jgi:hypothetical protein
MGELRNSTQRRYFFKWDQSVPWNPDYIELYRSRWELQNPCRICRRQAILCWTRTPNPERSSPISQTLLQGPLFSEILLTGSAIGGQPAGGGNIAIRRNIAVNGPRIRRFFH